VQAKLAALPPALFVDPELRANPRTMVTAALPLMVRWEILIRDAERYRLADGRRHPQFPFVDDVIAFQANFLAETIENEAYAPSPAAQRVRIRRGEIAPTPDRPL
jgi:hypothetical protein